MNKNILFFSRGLLTVKVKKTTSVSSSDALKTINDLEYIFTNSETVDEHLIAIRDLEKVC